MSRARRDIEKLQVELSKMKRVLGIAVHRLGGEMKFTTAEFATHREVGLDTKNYPFVATSFLIEPTPNAEHELDTNEALEASPGE